MCLRESNDHTRSFVPSECTTVYCILYFFNINNTQCTGIVYEKMFILLDGIVQCHFDLLPLTISVQESFGNL